MTHRMIPDKCHTKGYIKEKAELAGRLYWWAVVRGVPYPEDLAAALVFVGQYRQKYGYEPRDCELERFCLGMETILAISLSGWITHRDGIEEGSLERLIQAQATAA